MSKRLNIEVLVTGVTQKTIVRTLETTRNCTRNDLAMAIKRQLSDQDVAFVGRLIEAGLVAGHKQDNVWIYNWNQNV